MHPALRQTPQPFWNADTASGVAMVALLVSIVVASVQWHNARDLPRPTGVVNLVGNRADNGLAQGDVEDVTLRLPLAQGPFVASARSVRLNDERALVCHLLHDGTVQASIMPVMDDEVAMNYAPVVRNVEDEPGVLGICDAALAARLS